MNNKLAKELMEIVQKAYDEKYMPEEKWHRVNKCQAYYTGEGTYKVLRSYNTVVALYDGKYNVLYSYGRYSHTTYQHVRKFRNMMALENGGKPWEVEEINLELVNWFK